MILNQDPEEDKHTDHPAHLRPKAVPRQTEVVLRLTKVARQITTDPTHHLRVKLVQPDPVTHRIIYPSRDTRRFYLRKKMQGSWKIIP